MQLARALLRHRTLTYFLLNSPAHSVALVSISIHRSHVVMCVHLLGEKRVPHRSPRGLGDLPGSNYNKSTYTSPL